MKIGILTFHWATNYGAILQAYALQTYLEKLGHEVYIINYKPKQYKKNLLACFSTIRVWSYLSKLKEFLKERELDNFRKSYLNETILYESLNELQKNPPQMDIYICGSDQIWNPYFTTKGEGKPTSTYFLDFGEKDIKRIAYAVSFGCEDYPDAASNIAKGYINNFNAISVRENSGIQIVYKLGFANPIKLLDPTLLLQRDDYNFANTKQLGIQKRAVVYILRDELKNLQKFIFYLKKDYQVDTIDNFFNPNSLQEWINGIKNASIVLTNSFHGMVFSLIFHVPFIIILANHSSVGMNDRFKTLLSYLDLQNRMMVDFDIDKINELINEKINWQLIDSQLALLRGDTAKFFDQALS
ncbi:MAG TPA: polysaccharide pyruvyl transferase family protein [Prolixibacteraceae bacterium]|nr:polysaccharide pyruvyl transferase family protein [Prolixibacteraceae bacterium]